MGGGFTLPLIKNMQNTRYYDIAHIEEQMAKGVISRKKGQELVDKMYRQTKNDELEDFRKSLIEKQKRQTEFYREIRQNPNKFTQRQVQQAVEYFRRNPTEF